jgi:CubicO group peptidase (beta-lactamase class C family)
VRNFVVGWLLAALLAPSAQAADAPAATVAQRLDALTATVDGVPFVNGGVLVGESGATMFRRVEGYADFAARTPLDTDAVFQAASMAKPFTATAVLQLRDAGKLRLDDPVARHLPGFPYPDITVRHLLSHTSGLPDLELFEAMVAATPDKVIGGDDLIPALRAWREPLAFAPGARFRYSNINYQLLAAIVARASGEPFADYLRDRVFAPAGMDASYVLGGTPPRGAARVPVANHVLAAMYETVPQDVRTLKLADARQMRRIRYETVNLGETVGDQNVFTTLGDLQRFDRALRAGTLLSQASQDEAYAPLRLKDGSAYLDDEVYQNYGVRCSYGLGWEVCRHPAYGRLVGHVGYNRGIATMLYRNLDRDQFVAMYDNGDGADFAQKVSAIADTLNGVAPPALSRQRSLTRAYGAELLASGPVAALVLYGRHQGDPVWASTEAGMNLLGYDLLHNGHAALALEPFRLNALLHPASANAYDSYGEALAANGRTADAVLAYRRALELEPGNAQRRAALERLQAGAKTP